MITGTLYESIKHLTPRSEEEIIASFKDDPTGLLAYAADVGRLDLAQQAVKDGARVNTHDDYIFSLACQNNHTDVAKYLMNFVKDISSRRDFALRKAIENNNIELINLFIEKNIPVSRIAFHALEKNNFNVFKSVIDKIHANEFIVKAVTDARVDFVKLLLDNGADVDHTLSTTDDITGHYQKVI